MGKVVNNDQDVIDSRDVIEYFRNFDAHDHMTLEEQTEYEMLASLVEQGESSCSDWEYGASLIRDSYFHEYAQQFAEDIGAVSGSEKWPLNCIDWDQAAKDLQMDYTSIDFGGVTYWVR